LEKNGRERASEMEFNEKKIFPPTLEHLKASQIFWRFYGKISAMMHIYIVQHQRGSLIELMVRTGEQQRYSCF